MTACDSGLAQQFKKHDTVLYVVPGLRGEDTGARRSGRAAVLLWEAGTLCMAIPALQVEKPRECEEPSAGHPASP